MKNQNQKGIASSLALIVIIVIGVIAIGGVLAYQYLWAPEEKIEKKEEASKDETADWKTYRNEEYGFEVKYPKDWYAEENKKFGYVSILDTGGKVFPMMQQQKTDWMGITIGCEPKPNNLEKWLKSKDITEYKEFTQGELKGIKVIEVSGVGVENAFLSDEKQICGFRYYNEYYQKREKKKEEILNVFNQMLSTFRFLE